MYLEEGIDKISDEEMYYEGMRVMLDFSERAKEFTLAYGDW
jgi:hypothetical protein